jgi:hypothetical protein
MLEEHSFTCPYCWQQISMLLDLSAGEQSYVEDCEVCCNPIAISYQAEDGALISFLPSPISRLSDAKKRQSSQAHGCGSIVGTDALK